MDVKSGSIHEDAETVGHGDGAVDKGGIRSVAAVDDGVAGVGHQDVVARAAVEGVGPVSADQCVVAGSA